jgi:hypothetical protein
MKKPKTPKTVLVRFTLDPETGRKFNQLVKASKFKRPVVLRMALVAGIHALERQSPDGEKKP